MMPAWTAGVSEVLKRQAALPPMTPEYLAFNNAHRILAITSSFFTIAIVVVLLRCYVRIAMLKVFGPDDYMMAVAAVSANASKTRSTLTF
jgi:hypothetical protein